MRAPAWSPSFARHAWPVAAVLLVFGVSRVWAHMEGVRFDPAPLGWGWQFLDVNLLRHRLLQSVWYLHAQPPLYNLLLGIGVKLFGSAFSTAAEVVQVGIGIVISIALYAALVAVRIARWVSAGATALFAASPAMLLFESWLFYEYVVAALLLLAVVAFAAFERRPKTIWSALVFTSLAALCFIRASFQIPVLLLALGLMLVAFRGARRAVVMGALVPVLLVIGLYVKNEVIFGTATTSSWAGMNLYQVVQPGFKPGQEQAMKNSGLLNSIAGESVFQPLAAYSGYVMPNHEFDGIPALTAVTKSDGTTPNFNNVEYIAVSKLYMHDFWQVLFHAPSVYLRGVWLGIKTAVFPSSDYAFFMANRSKIASWVRAYDTSVLWQSGTHVVDNVPTGTAWGIVVYYLAALVFGFVEALRVLARRRGSATLAFTWLIVFYATAVMVFGEVEENQRVRFVTDPLVTILVVALIVRAVGAARRNRVFAWTVDRS